MIGDFLSAYLTTRDSAVLICKDSITLVLGFIDVGVNKLIISRLPLVS